MATVKKNAMSDYLTTKELAELLRIKERKVYDLAASGDVPCSRATGKLLFPRQAIEDWIASASTGKTKSSAKPARPPVLLGSHDPLLDWAIRESRSGIATIFDGSLDGLRRFQANEGAAAGIHIFDPVSQDWNVAEVSSPFSGENVVLMEWAKRQRGLVTTKENAKKIAKIGDLKTARIAARQAEAGTQRLLEHLLQKEDLELAKLDMTAPARTETDAVLAILEGKADATFGLQALADQYGLAFAPIITERFDILVDRKFWFEPGWQKFLTFCHSADFVAKAAELPGYDVKEFGTVHFNG